MDSKYLRVRKGKYFEIKLKIFVIIPKIDAF